MPPHKIHPECKELFTRLKEKTDELVRDTKEIKKAVSNHYGEMTTSQHRIETSIKVSQVKHDTDMSWMRYLITGIVVVFALGILTGIGVYLFQNL